MRRTIGKLFIALLVLLALYLLVLWTEWFPLSTSAGKKAVAIMSAPLPPIAADKNAFSEIWLFAYDIPEADKTKIMAADIKHYLNFHDDMKYGSSAEGKYPKFEDGENLLCKPKQESCIGQIRSNKEKYEQFFAKNEKLVNKASAITKFRISRSEFRPHIYTPLANFPEVFNWQLTTAAYWHVQGKHVEGIDLACRTAASWRSMAQNSHGLIDQMVGQSFYSSVTALTSELLSETPPELDLPASCTEAYLPVVSRKFPICHSMKIEFQTLLNATESVAAGERPAYFPLGRQSWLDKVEALWFNKRASKETFALGYVDQCSDDKEIMEEIGKPKEAFWNEMSLTEVGFNPVGSILASMTRGSYSDYANRIGNLSLTQQAMQAVFLKRAENNGLENQNKNLRFSPDLQAIEVDLYRSPGKTDLLRLPLTNTKP
ncbi:MAG: hypothetical protein ACREPB_01505 [Arenimonas sp.]